ncbi:MAG: lamin tail domain-containing protein [Ardenticatenaceae bacterium]|nr:lamin tail domain-containing protein [Ardenticatenaceae bacterium]
MGRRLVFALALTAAALLLPVHSLGAVRDSTTNLLSNPGFEEGTGGWTLAPSTATVLLTTPAHGGAWAAGLTKASKTGYVTLGQTVAVEPGAGYELSGWVLWRNAAASNARLRLSWLDAGGTRLGERVELDAPARAGDYQFLASGAPLTAPPAAAGALVECYTYLNAPDPAEPTLFDDLALTLLAPAATATPTPSPTPTSTATWTPSATATPTPSPTPTSTATASPSATPTPTATGIPPATPTATGTASATASATGTPTSSATPSATASPTPTGTASPTPSATVAPLPALVINEYLPRPATDWNGDGETNSRDEYIELYNAGSDPVDLDGWQLDDVADGGAAPYTFGAGITIAPGAHRLIFNATSHVGLNDGGDEVRLLAPDGRLADSHSYTGVDPDVAWQRAGDGASTWRDDWPPSPGAPNRPPPASATPTVTPSATPSATVAPSATATATPPASVTPTPTPSPSPSHTVTVSPTSTPLASATATPTVSPSSTPTVSPSSTPSLTPTATPFAVSVRLNEVLPAPKNVDWDGDGSATAEDEWVELYNEGSAVVDLSGWQLDDIVDGGSRPYTLPAGTHLQPGAFLLFFRHQTGVALNNDSDTVRLLWPDGTPFDTYWYSRPAADASYSRDATGTWHTDWPPSPGAPNLPPTLTPTPLPSPTPTASATATITPSPTKTATPTRSPTASPTIAPGLPVRLNEFLPAPKNVDWDGDGTATAADEWVELLNQGPAPVDLGGWQLDDVANGGSQPYTLPAGTRIDPGEVLLLFRRQTGVALNNDGDEVRLLRPDGTPHDAFVFRRTTPDASYSRDVAGAWQTGWPPSPGQPNRPPTPTPTPSPTAPVPTATPFAASVRLNEFLPAPKAVDWDGDGTATAEDEWVELHNEGSVVVDLSGWQLDDVADGGSRPYTLPGGSRIDPGGFLLLFRRQTGVALNNDSDTVRLLWPDGTPFDTYWYSRPAADASYSRDAAGAWHAGWPPSPGAPNLPPTPTPTPSITPVPTATVTPSPTRTAGPTRSPTATATIAPDLPLRLNEFLPAPKAIDWDGDGTAGASDEWIELYNGSLVTLDLGGWQLDDVAAGGSRPYTLPAGTRLAPGELLLFRRQSGVALNNTGDEVRLLRPDGSLHDAFTFDHTSPDASYSRDAAGAWHEDWPPSPGRPNEPPAATPSPTTTPTASATSTPTVDPDAPVQLNELLPAPKNVDWDGDGSATAEDEWVELFNAGPEAVALGGWQLDDIAGGGSSPYTLPPGTTLVPNELLLLFRHQTGIALNNDGDEVRLLRPDGSLHDSFAFDRTAPDASYSRDTAGAWQAGWPPSPGRPNLSPTPTNAWPGRAPGHQRGRLRRHATGRRRRVRRALQPDRRPGRSGGVGVGDEVRAGGSEGLYRFPPHTLAPGAVVLVARSAAAFQARFGALPDFELDPGAADLPEVPNLVRDTGWGRGRWALSDSGDEVILLDPHDRLVDALAFRNGDVATLGLSGHDISAPAPRSLNRVADWASAHLNDVLVYQSPSPGRPLLPPSAPPAPPAPAFGEGFFAFWGTLHAHSTYSDGSGPPAYAYAVARANGQHFLALSDHSNWFDQAEWEALGAAADAADAPGEFVALRAFEWSSRDNGHVNVFASDDFISRDEPDGDSLADLYAFLAARPAALGEFNHPFPGDFDGLRFEPARRDQMALIEVGNGRPAFFRRYAEAYWQALFTGWRVGAAANLDTETPDWGADGALRTGILAPTLERAALLEAIRARRTFGTEDQNLALALRAGAVWMGSEVAPGPLSLTVLAADADAEEATLELWREGAAVVSTTLPLGATPESWTLALDARPGEVLVARAVQADGDQAWTSPLFVRGDWQPPALLITEVLPAPRDVDFNGDGLRDSNDEFIELHNPLDRAVSLGGWQVDDAEGGSRPYVLPIGTALPPGGYLVLYKSQSGVALDQVGDHARLIAPDGTLVDDVTWSRFPGYDRSLSRNRAGTWLFGATPSPGGPMPEASSDDETASPSSGGAGTGGDAALPTTLAEARRLPLGRRVTVQGQVSAPPGVFGETTVYLQAGGAGLRVYLRRGALPALALGDWVEVTGTLGSYFGERELRPASPAALRRLGPGPAPTPLSVATGRITAAEGLLVWLRGGVTGWSRNRWTLDDGSGPATVVLRASTGLRRPWLERGEVRAVVGIAARDGDEVFVLPRTVADLAPDLLGPPLLLPETGGARGEK